MKVEQDLVYSALTITVPVYLFLLVRFNMIILFLLPTILEIVVSTVPIKSTEPLSISNTSNLIIYSDSKMKSVTTVYVKLGLRLFYTTSVYPIYLNWVFLCLMNTLTYGSLLLITSKSFNLRHWKNSSTYSLSSIILYLLLLFIIGHPRYSTLFYN